MRVKVTFIMTVLGNAITNYGTQHQSKPVQTFVMHGIQIQMINP